MRPIIALACCSLGFLGCLGTATDTGNTVGEQASRSSSSTVLNGRVLPLPTGALDSTTETIVVNVVPSSSSTLSSSSGDVANSGSVRVNVKVYHWKGQLSDSSGPWRGAVLMAWSDADSSRVQRAVADSLGSFDLKLYSLQPMRLNIEWKSPQGGILWMGAGVTLAPDKIQLPDGAVCLGPIGRVCSPEFTF